MEQNSLCCLQDIDVAYHLHTKKDQRLNQSDEISSPASIWLIRFTRV